MTKKKPREEWEKMGRPTKWNDNICQVMLRLYAKGKTDLEVCELVGIDKTTLYEWKKRYPEFKESIKEIRAKADELVENALYQSAMGYEHDSEEIKVMTDETGKQVIKRVKTKKKYPPNPKSLQFWLKNRQPEKWRDEKHVTGTVTLEDLLTESRESGEDK